MTRRVIVTIGQLLILAAMLVVRLDAGLFGQPAWQYIFAFYFLVVVFTLPSLLSKVLFSDSYFGFTSALMFLVYPLVYLVTWIVSRKLGIGDYQVVAVGISYFLLMLWHLLFGVIIWTDKKLVSFAKYLPLLGIVMALYMLFVFAPLRQPDSVVALDYLQHKTVVNQMSVQDNFCLQPADCSNLFLQAGYTTFFHSVLAVIIQGSGIDFGRLAYILDLVFPLIMAAVLFKLAIKATGRALLAFVASAIGVLTFENFAYTTQFFIPQTFAFLLYLQIISADFFTRRRVVMSTILLTVTHFIMGPFLILQLVTFYLSCKWRKIPESIPLWIKSINWFPPVLLAFVMALNIAGFSIERDWQTGAVDNVGAYTNLYSPENLRSLFFTAGFAMILLLLGLWFTYRQKVRNVYLSWAINSIYFSLLVYFLAPTYAGKFLIGLGFMLGLVFVNYLRRLVRVELKLVVISTVIILMGFNMYVNYKHYLHFYKQVDGTVSAYTYRDNELLAYLGQNTKTLACEVVSDPYTQIIVASGTNYSTARAHYMSTEARNLLFDFVLTPNADTYTKLKAAGDFPQGKVVCFDYSFRLTDTKQENQYWIDNMYNYNLSVGKAVSVNDAVVSFLSQNGYMVVYASPNHILLAPR